MASSKWRQSGNVMLALFAAIGAVGVIGATGMNVIKGPVRSMHNVTQKTIAENNMIASGKLALIAAAAQGSGGDCDADSRIEPVAWSVTGIGPKPAGGGYLPSNIGASLQDPWGNTYGYCAWDHGTQIQTGCSTPARRLRGVTNGAGPVIAIISSGPDRTFQTSCANGPTYVNKVSGSDDIILSYTYEEAAALTGGLWTLQAGAADTAEIAKNLEVKNTDGDTTFALDSATGIGDFIGIRTGSIAAKGVEPVSMAGGLKVDSDTNVTQCSQPEHAGILRYHATNGLEVCNGSEWLPAGGGAVPDGTIAAFAMNNCPDGWAEYTPARGRFLRGRDPTGANDAVRNAGHIQGDSNRSHTHTGTAASAGGHNHEDSTAGSAGNHTHSGKTETNGAHSHGVRRGSGNGNGSYVDDNPSSDGATIPTTSAGAHYHLFTTYSAGAHTHDLTIKSDGAHTHTLTINANGGSESRPKNVAVTYCQYQGGVPVKDIAGLGNLEDVVLSAPQVGQILTYNGTNWTNQPVADGVPSGAVMPFNLNNCPSGWSPLAGAQGRFIVGVGGGYARGDTGGADTVTLTVAQMPNHRHTGTTGAAGNHNHGITAGGTNTVVHGAPYMATDGADGKSTYTRYTGNAGNHTHSFTTAYEGGGDPHENRPPYLALLYCQKN